MDNNKKREYQNNFEDCFDELKYQYQEVLGENKKLQDYIKVIADLCQRHNIEIPTIEEQVEF